MYVTRRDHYKRMHIVHNICMCAYQYPHVHVYTYAYMYNAMWQTVYINLLIHVCAEGLHFSALCIQAGILEKSSSEIVEVCCTALYVGIKSLVIL